MTDNKFYETKIIFLNLIIAICVSIFAIISVSFFVPFIKAVIPAFSSSGSAPKSFYLNASQLVKTTLFTFAQAIVSTLISIVIGVPAAFFVAKRKFFGRKFLLSFSSVPLCIPALIVALGFISTFGMAGYLNKVLMFLFKLKEPPVTFLYSFWGIVITQGFYNFPLVMKTVSDTWSILNTDEEDSARLLGAGEFKVFRTITFFQIIPSIISAVIPIFLFCFFSFMIVLLFGATGSTTLEVAIYHAGRSTLDFKTAGILSLIETLCALFIIFIYSKAEKSGIETKGISFIPQKRESFSKDKAYEIFIFSILLLLIFIFFFIPLLSILIASFTSRSGGNLHFSFEAWKRLFKMKTFSSSLFNTFATAFATGTLCSITGFTYAFFLRRKDPYNSRTLLKTIAIIPMAVSSVVMGIGMSMLVKKGTPIILVLAQVSLFWPFAFRQIYSHMTKIPEDILNAGDILSKHFCISLFRIVIPYTWKGILSSFAFCFALSAGDASIPLVLSIPKFNTLALFTYRLAGSFKFAEASASGLLLGIICIAVFVLAQKINSKEN